MKKLLLSITLLLGVAVIYAQDIISLTNGDTIKGQVAEVGLNEIRYYKTTNLQGPVYVTAKSEVKQVTYANGSSDVFAVVPQQQNIVVVQQPSQQTVIISEPVARRRNFWNSRIISPVISTHFDIGRHSRGYRSGHHYRGHH